MKHAISNLFTAILFTAGAASAAVPTPPGVTRTDLQRHDLSIAGRETVQARIDIAPGGVAPWHRHPGEEVIYVIEGTLEYQLEGQPPVTVTADVVASDATPAASGAAPASPTASEPVSSGASAPSPPNEGASEGT